jgi:hypothetical protein
MKKNILIIDDDLYMVNLLDNYFKKGGLQYPHPYQRKAGNKTVGKKGSSIWCFATSGFLILRALSYCQQIRQVAP